MVDSSELFVNKKVITIAILTIAAFITLTLYSFGPLAGQRKAAGRSASSLHPTPSSADAVAAPGAATAAATYHNADAAENHYAIDFPEPWRVGPGKDPGGYAVGMPGGSGDVRLMDVPDNTTLELFVLSQEEPRIKKAAVGYLRLSYDTLSLKGSDAYRLIYRAGAGGATSTTMTTYVAGADRAAVVTFSAPQQGFDALRTAFESATASFRWEK
jgi:hypothetical protein